MLQISRRLRASAGGGLALLPDPLVRGLVGRATVRDGQSLDPRMKLVCQLAGLGPGSRPWELPVQRARAVYEDFCTMLDAPAPAVSRIVLREAPGPRGGVPLRILYGQESARPQPVLVYLHGGGFTIGSVRSHDALCKRLALEARCIVVAVDYRLAPEHPFPAGLEDGLAAYRWVTDNASELGADASRVAIGGDSAGGNLAAVLAQTMRGDPLGPCYQLLIYPSTDLSGRTGSHALFSKGFLLEKQLIDWFEAQYVPEGVDRRDPRLSPLLAQDLSGLAPAHLITAGFDPLRDEGEAYAEALSAAGVAVRYSKHGSMVHGFATMSAFVPVRAAIREMASGLQQAFGTLDG